MDLAADEGSGLVEWTLRAFDVAIRALLERGGLRRTHERVRSDLRNRLRGRLDVVGLTRNLARGRPQLPPGAVLDADGLAAIQ